MKLTDQQRAAVKTWRKGRHYDGVILSDLPFTDRDNPLDADAARWHGAKFFVGENMSDEALDFILAATKRAVQENES